MPEQLSPPAEDDTHHQRTRINSADDNSISPLPASSPATGPLLSPNTISSHIRAPSSLNCSQAVKTTYNFAGNGLSNGFTYSGSRLATQHHLPQSNPSLPQSTPCPPFFAPPYPLTTCPQVATAPPTHPVTMSNVVFPFYSTHSGQDNYNSAPINSSAVNIWNPWWVKILVCVCVCVRAVCGGRGEGEGINGIFLHNARPDHTALCSYLYSNTFVVYTLLDRHVHTHTSTATQTRFPRPRTTLHASS